MRHGATAGTGAVRTRPTGRTLALGAAKAAVLLFIVGADCSNKGVGTALDVQLVGGIAPEVSVRVVGQLGGVAPGGTAQRSVFVQCPKPGGPDAVSLLWYPPAGATALAFPDLQPTNPQGPAPYEFSGVPVSDVADALPAASVTVAYAAPAPPRPVGAATIVDTFTAVTAAGNRHSVSFEDADGAGSASLAASAGDAGGALDARALAGARLVANDYSWWSAEETVTPTSAVALDQSLCQGWADLLQGGAFFVALRFPVLTPDAADPRSVPLPVVAPVADEFAPRLDLRATQPAPATVFSVPLELRPDRLGFAENNLPQADGERWVTLAPTAQPAAVCPADLAGEWQVVGDISLDFGGAASSCAECVLQEYLCYEGSPAPFFFATSGSSLGAQSVYHGAGTTCVGPIPVRLASTPPVPPVTLEGAGLTRSSANALVKFAHHLRGWLAPDGETTVTLSTASARGIRWQLYSDSGLHHPIGGPVTISGSAQFDFWAATQLPFGFHGPESVTVTAVPSDPADTQAWTGDFLWAGAWTPPPPVPELHAGASVVERGGLVTVSGVLPDGAYRLAMVPNGTYLPGGCYTGPVLASADVIVSNTILPPTLVWVGAAAGTYDILALAGPCGSGAIAAQGVTALSADDARIVTGDDLGPAPAVTVSFSVHRHIRR